MNLAGLFSDGMVFQQNRPVRVWGWDTPGRDVAVAVNGCTVSVVVDEQGPFINAGMQMRRWSRPGSLTSGCSRFRA